MPVKAIVANQTRETLLENFQSSQRPLKTGMCDGVYHRKEINEKISNVLNILLKKDLGVNSEQSNVKLQKLVSKLEKHHKKKLDLSLGRTFNLLKKLGNPQDKLRNIVTVVGTNAKASMSYSLKSILNQAGLRCNMYTSPHLQSYTERFVFNDNEIDEENLFELLVDIEKVLGEDNATVFELLTCAF